MTKLTDFIKNLETYVTSKNTVPSTEEIEQAMRSAAVPVLENGTIKFQFMDGELLTLNSCVHYATMLVA